MSRPWTYLFLTSLLATGLFFTRLPWLVVPIQASLAWIVLWSDLTKGKLNDGARHMLYWALLTSVWTITFTVFFPEAAAASIFKGPAYREEMFSWIRTGVGAESNPRLFVPQHILHYGMTLALSLVTAGWAGLALGVILLNYMNFYVGELIRTGAHPLWGILFGWPIWPVLRVIGFVFGAIGVAHIFVARILRRSPYEARPMRRLLILSAGLFLADMLVKGLLSPYWRRLLAHALLP